MSQRPWPTSGLGDKAGIQFNLNMNLKRMHDMVLSLLPPSLVSKLSERFLQNFTKDMVFISIICVLVGISSPEIVSYSLFTYSATEGSLVTNNQMVSIDLLAVGHTVGLSYSNIRQNADLAFV